MKYKQRFQISIKNRLMENFPLLTASGALSFLNADRHHSKKQPPRPARQKSAYFCCVLIGTIHSLKIKPPQGVSSRTLRNHDS